MSVNDAELKKLKAEKAQYESNINKYTKIRYNYYGFKNNANKAKHFLEGAKKDFKKGGYVVYGTPLLAKEFDASIEKLALSVDSVNNVIRDLSSKIEKNENNLKKCNKRIAELTAQ